MRDVTGIVIVLPGVPDPRRMPIVPVATIAGIATTRLLPVTATKNAFIRGKLLADIGVSLTRTETLSGQLQDLTDLAHSDAGSHHRRARHSRYSEIAPGLHSHHSSPGRYPNERGDENYRGAPDSPNAKHSSHIPSPVTSPVGATELMAPGEE